MNFNIQIQNTQYNINTDIQNILASNIQLTFNQIFNHQIQIISKQQHRESKINSKFKELFVNIQNINMKLQLFKFLDNNNDFKLDQISLCSQLKKFEQNSNGQNICKLQLLWLIDQKQSIYSKIIFIDIFKLELNHESLICIGRAQNGIIIFFYKFNSLILLQQKLNNIFNSNNIILINNQTDIPQSQFNLEKISNENKIFIYSKNPLLQTSSQFHFFKTFYIPYSQQLYQPFRQKLRQKIIQGYNQILEKQNKYFNIILKKSVTIVYLLMRCYFINIIQILKIQFSQVTIKETIVNLITKLFQGKAIPKIKKEHYPTKIRSRNSKCFIFCIFCLNKRKKFKFNKKSNTSHNHKTQIKIKRTKYYCEGCQQILGIKICLCILCFKPFHLQQEKLQKQPWIFERYMMGNSKNNQQQI